MAVTFKRLLLNPVVWLVNLFQYLSHLESQRYAQRYEPYDFAGDLKRF